MSVPRKLGIIECKQCHYPCSKEIFKITHEFKDSGQRSQDLTFCGRKCMMEYFEIAERALEKVEREIAREKAELYKRVCPACVRRFVELS